jgi:uncharacterized protein YjbI with pentapeptide repeats
MRRIGAIVAMLLLSIISVPLVFAIATFPGEWLEQEQKALPVIAPLRQALVAGEVDTYVRRPKSLWSDRLVLPGLDVIDHSKLDTEAKIAPFPVTASLRARQLEGAVLIGAGLRKVDFTASNLEAANLEGADLRAAKLDDTQLRDASLGYAQLQDASLDDAKLQGARLVGAGLRGARLVGAELQGADLAFAHLQGARLDRAELKGATLDSAQLQGADLYRVGLQGATLDGAQLQGASLYEAKLQGAYLDGAQLQGASLDRAQLQGAVLRRAQLQAASIREAFVWRTNARTAEDATDARIDKVESRAKIPGPYDVVDWHAGFFSDLKYRIERIVPEGVNRERALSRVNILDPETLLDEEKQMAEYWDKLQSLSPAPAVYEAKRAERWRLIGCSADGAPYVLAGLIRTMASAYSPFSSDSVQVRKLAADLLKDDCAGERGLSEDARATLKALRDRAAQGRVSPSSHTQ